MIIAAISENFGLLDYAIMIGYVLAIVGLGSFFVSKEKNTEDYLLGGRNFPWWAITLSIFVTAFSAISFLAIPEEAYSNGVRLWLTSLLGPIFILPAMWMFLAFYYKLGSFTPYEYIEKRFSPKVRLLASVLFMIQKGLYLAIILYASARAFKSAVGWDPFFTIVFIGILGTLYTTLGGMKAVVWTDVAQFFVLGGGVLLAVIIIVSRIDGGVAEIFRFAFDNDRGFNLDKSFISFDPYERATLWWMIIAAIGAIFGCYATDQLMIQRLLSTKSYSEAKKAVFMSVPTSIIILGMFWFVGIALFCYYHKNGDPEMINAGDSAENIFTFFIGSSMPSPIPGLIMAGLLAAIMSTVDSAVNSLTAIALKDVYARFIRPEADEKQQLKVARYMTAVWGVYMIIAAMIIYWISEKSGSTIWEISALWQSLGGLILGIYILGVCSRYIETRLALTSAGVAGVLLIAGIIKFHYMGDVDHRISFMLVGNIGFIGTVVIGFAGIFCNKYILRKSPAANIEGLTLGTVDRKSLK